MIEGVDVEVGPEAVVVTARTPLVCVSSALVGGGFAGARAILNLHVRKDAPRDEADAALASFIERRRVVMPFVGLLTSAWTEKAEIAEERAGGITALAVATVGLGNPVSAGFTPTAAWSPSTINTIVLVDVDADPAALVNTIMTVTEVKALAMIAAGVRCADGRPASGTSTDAVVIAATGRGARCRFGGPISELGSVVARAAGAALGAGIARWRAEHA